MSDIMNDMDDLRSKIKQMEREQRGPLAEEKTVSFDSWFFQRKDKIPKHHMKEVIFADFTARGLDKEATVEQYDKALRLYGIKI
jgi:hypothetical protein